MNYVSINTDCVDKDGAPITFAIDTEGVLSVMFRPKDPSDVWAPYQLTDPAKGLKARVLGVSQNSNGDIYAVLAAGQDATAPANRLFRTAALPNNPDDAVWGALKDRWSEMALNPRPTGITEILVNAPANDSEQPMIVLGTTDRVGKIPVYQRVKFDVADVNVETFPILANPDEFLDIQPGRTGYGARGVYVLYRRAANFVLEFQGAPDKFKVRRNATLQTPPGAITLQSKTNEDGETDLFVRGNGLYLFRADNQRSGAIWTKIADDDLLSDRITSRSSITNDYARNGAGRLEPYPAFRTSVTFPPGTQFVDLWASSDTEVEVNGRKHQIDAVKPARIAAPRALKLSISIPAKDNLSCAHLMVNTNLMRPEQRHLICPDVELHKKLTQLQPNALHQARDRLGIDPTISKEDLATAQSAIQNLSRTVQYAYNRREHGVFHDRAILPRNMQDTHFKLDFGGGRIGYSSLTKPQVKQHVAGATPGIGAAQAVSFDDFWELLKKAGSIVVYTLEGVAKDVADAVTHAGEHAVVMFDQLGEDLVHGDASSFAKHLLQGGAAIGIDLFTGAANVVGQLVSGAGQLLGVAFEWAGKVVTFILDHTGLVGAAIRGLFERIGAAAAKVLAWLVDAIGGEDVLHVHDVLIDSFNSSIEGMKNQLERVKELVDKGIGDLESQVSRIIDAALGSLGGLRLNQEPSRSFSLSTAIEQSEWLLSKIPEGSANDSPAPASPGPAGEERSFSLNANVEQIEKFLQTLESKFGSESPIYKSLSDNVENLLGLFSQGIPSAEDLIRAFLKLGKSLVVLILEAAKVIVDALIEIVEGALTMIKQLMNARIEVPILSEFYTELTKGKELTVIGLIALFVAIPVALAGRTILGRPLRLTTQGVAAGLPGPTAYAAAIEGWGITYGVVRILDSAIALASDAYNGIGGYKHLQGELAGQAQGIGQGRSQMPSSLPKRFRWRYDNLKSEVNPTRGEVSADIFFRVWGLWSGWMAVAGAVPVSGLGFGLGNPSLIGPVVTDVASRDSELNAPSYWGSAYWIAACVQLSLSVVLTSISIGVETLGLGKPAGLNLQRNFSLFNDVQILIGGVFGIVYTVTTSALDIADRNKVRYLKKNYFQLVDQSDGNSDYKTSPSNSWQTWTGWTWTKKDANGNDTTEYFIPTNAFLALPTGAQTSTQGTQGTQATQQGTQQQYAAYLKWAEQGGLNQPPDIGDPLHVKRLWGIERKGFANVIGSLQGIGQLTAFSFLVQDTGGLSLIPTAILDVLGGIGEGSTHLVRVQANELY